MSIVNPRPERSHLRIAARSSVWLIVEKVFVLGLSFAVSILLARYLGPTDFGALNFAIAYIAIIGAAASLGLGGGAVVRELVEDPQAAGEILGTTLVLRAAAGVAAVGLALILAVAAGLSERSLIFLIALSLPLDAAATLRLLFEARVAAQRVMLAAIAAAITGAVLRVFAIYLDGSLWIFAAIIPIQALITAILLFVVFSKSGLPLAKLRYRGARARLLLRESWPLMISAAGAVLYLKLDQFMLGEMAGMAAVGIYSVAARLSEVWYVLPTALGAAIAPRLLELRNSNKEMYEFRLKQAFRYSFWLGAAVAICVSIIAVPLIVVLYGEAYRQAGMILVIHIWTCPAVFIGVILQKWFVAERLLIKSFNRHLLGAAVNVVLNLILIPRWGGMGAAVATLISYTVANILACFIGRRTFEVGIWMMQAVVTPQKMFTQRA